MWRQSPSVLLLLAALVLWRRPQLSKNVWYLTLGLAVALGPWCLVSVYPLLVRLASQLFPGGQGIDLINVIVVGGTGLLGTGLLFGAVIGSSLAWARRGAVAAICLSVVGLAIAGLVVELLLGPS
ncbi:MAG: hypothetical protein SFW67_29885 [Myxococcaceae bacterium]|nr:hypothetical protein [Myxococcaceae bacterium]